jgi:hypothetical protein
LTSS